MNSELRNFFETTLRKELRDLEPLREWCMLLTALGIIAAFAAVITALYYKGLAILITVIPLGIAGLLFFKAYEIWNKYKGLFKQNVVDYLVCFVNPDWEYIPTSKISKDTYAQSGLSSSIEIDKYEGGDLIRGKIDNVNFECSTLTIKPYPEEDNGEAEGIISVEIPSKFKEVFFYADLQKKIAEKTFVFPNRWWNGILGEEEHKVPVVQIGQPDFERVFDVHSVSPIEARHILTPEIMEMILRLKKKYNTDVRFSFIGSRVYGVIDFEESLFNPRILRSSVEFDDMVAMHDLIKMIENIIQELKVNLDDMELLEGETLDEKVRINVSREDSK